MSEQTSTQTVEEGVVEALATMGPTPDRIHRDATFEELDIDSLDLVELLQIAEEKWGVRIEADDARDVRVVGQAIDLIHARVAEAA